MAVGASQSQSQSSLQPHGVMQGYDPGPFFCEMLRQGSDPDPSLTLLLSRLAALPIESLRQRATEAERDLLERGITFTVYSDATAIDRILPFDLIPRVITAQEWAQLETGVIQRVRALNMFLYDIYHERTILKDGIVPEQLVLGNSGYCEAMVGFDVPFNTYVHICGTDIVRDEEGTFRVLEDNARTPSGVAYVVENRHMSMRVFSDLMTGLRVRSVDEYGLRLHNAMADIAPAGVADPQVVVLSPGIFNSAYFEHVFLAREMGIPLVEGRDLTVENGKVWMHTTAGQAPVHTIYRRIGDDFLDPDMFNPDSMLGVRGLIEAWRKGNVAIANAVGTGVADDKAIYAYMPRIIKYYLSEEPILPNVDTRICAEPDALAYTLDHLHELVVKPVAESGGYGLLIGPHASKAQLEEFRTLLKADPSNYISQPTLKLSVSPTLTEDGVRPRHIDLRPFAVTGKDTWVLPGGLTRVALRAGTLVVNSSQGGGSKDTWVLA
ncbi:circularly permuted type 2 ATP-grasp protein [Rhodopila sp.]|uniref:circularly permuted type 2 ATP-grasp protein n=1 Tax=Rhodopila sp. TaxID=2480087 RepID=UPI0038D17478